MTNIVEEAQHNRLEGVRRALDEGADINAKTANGDTALLWAAWQGNTEIIRLLIERGADLNLGNANGSPLTLANKANRTDAAALIAAAIAGPPKPSERWEKLGESSIAHIGVYRAAGQKLTSVFNFKSRDRIVIAQDLDKSSPQTVGPSTSFDTLAPAAIEEALDQFTKQGGKADRDFVLNGASALGKPKLRVGG